MCKEDKMALQGIKNKFYKVALTTALLVPGVAAAQDTNSIPTMTAAQAKALSKQPENCNKPEAIFRPVVWYNGSTLPEISAKALASVEKEEEGVDIIPVKGNTGGAKAYLCGHETKTISKDDYQTPVFDTAGQGAGALTTMVNYYIGNKGIDPLSYRISINSMEANFPTFPTKQFKEILPKKYALGLN